MSVWEDQLAVDDVRLAPELGSVVAARRLVRDAATAWGLGDRAAHDAALVASELVTNAVLHAGTDIVVSVRPLHPGARIEVRDGSGHVPAGETEGTGELRATRSMTGRGLAVVAALADGWGVDPAARGGKVTWAEVGTGDGPRDRLGPVGAADRPPSDRHTPRLGRRTGRTRSPARGGGSAGGLRPERSRVAPVPPAPAGRRVLLSGVPVRLLVRSGGQFADLLREVQVIALDPAVRGGPGDLADVGRRLALSMGALSEQGLRAAEAALARGEAVADVEVVVPDDAVDPFAGLGSLLDRLTESVSGLPLLTEPATGEVEAFRRWCGEEVGRQMGQMEGGPPRPCPFGAHPAG